MRRHRRGLLHRCTALLLACAMPLCCCIVHNFTGGSCCSQFNTAPACCSTPVQSCCADSSQAESGDQAPCDAAGSCMCCTKAPSPSFDWQVPVDTLGTLMIDMSCMVSHNLVASTMPMIGFDAHAPPGAPDAAPLRGMIILNC